MAPRTNWKGFLRLSLATSDRDFLERLERQSACAKPAERKPCGGGVLEASPVACFKAGAAQVVA
jgi:hypothetical protein